MTGFPALKEHIPAEQWQDKKSGLGSAGESVNQPGSGDID